MGAEESNEALAPKKSLSTSREVVSDDVEVSSDLNFENFDKFSDNLNKSKDFKDQFEEEKERNGRESGSRSYSDNWELVSDGSEKSEVSGISINKHGSDLGMKRMKEDERNVNGKDEITLPDGKEGDEGIKGDDDLSFVSLKSRESEKVGAEKKEVDLIENVAEDNISNPSFGSGNGVSDRVSTMKTETGTVKSWESVKGDVESNGSQQISRIGLSILKEQNETYRKPEESSVVVPKPLSVVEAWDQAILEEFHPDPTIDAFSITNTQTETFGSAMQKAQEAFEFTENLHSKSNLNRASKLSNSNTTLNDYGSTFERHLEQLNLNKEDPTFPTISNSWEETREEPNPVGSPEMDYNSQSSFVSKAFKEIDDILRHKKYDEANIDDNRKSKTLSEEFFALEGIIKEILRGAFNNNKENFDFLKASCDDNDGLSRISNAVSEEDEIKILKQIFSKEQTVQSLQNLLSSSAVRNSIVDICLNDCQTKNEVRSILMNHVGYLLPDIGVFFQRCPQVLVLFPFILKSLLTMLGDADNQIEGEVHNCCANAATQTEAANNRKESYFVLHEHVSCDSCLENQSRRQISEKMGYNVNGFIAGSRFKSVVTEDFDLCTSCEKTGNFDKSNGPFLEIKSVDQCPKEIIVVLQNKNNLSSKENLNFSPFTKVTVTTGSQQPDEANHSSPAEQQVFDRIQADLHEYLSNTQTPEADQTLKQGEKVEESVDDLVCPLKKHHLQQHLTPTGLFVCDVCERRVPIGRLLFGCRKCDWDICHKCAVDNYKQFMFIKLDDGLVEVKPKPRVYKMSVVSHESFPPMAKVVSNQPFQKRWRVRNDSDFMDWPALVKIMQISESDIKFPSGGQLVCTVPSGCVGIISADFIAPSSPGIYRSNLALANGKSGKLLENGLLELLIEVVPGSSETHPRSKETSANVPSRSNQNAGSSPYICRSGRLGPFQFGQVQGWQYNYQSYPTRYSREARPVFEAANSSVPRHHAANKQKSLSLGRRRKDFVEQLKVLKEMNFLDEERNLRLLKRMQGDLGKVVNRLLERANRNAGHCHMHKQ